MPLTTDFRMGRIQKETLAGGQFARPPVSGGRRHKGTRPSLLRVPRDCACVLAMPAVANSGRLSSNEAFRQFIRLALRLVQRSK